MCRYKRPGKGGGEEEEKEEEEELCTLAHELGEAVLLLLGSGVK